jgi:SHAQKYF class myb-like DNA-binding protein
MEPDSQQCVKVEEARRKRRKRPARDQQYDSPTFACEDPSEEMWPQELHRCFVSALFDCGVRNSSPSVIMENMSMRPAMLTSERVKSHLQKFRKRKEKARDEFMSDYDSFMSTALSVAGAGSMIMPPNALLEMIGGKMPCGGDRAAFLSYSVMMEGRQEHGAGVADSLAEIPSLSLDKPSKESLEFFKNYDCARVPFPQLTEEEKRSSLGKSLLYVMGLFGLFSQHMMQERRKRFKEDSSSGQAGQSISGTVTPISTSKQPESAFRHRERLLSSNSDPLAIEEKSPPRQVDQFLEGQKPGRKEGNSQLWSDQYQDESALEGGKMNSRLKTDDKYLDEQSLAASAGRPPLAQNMRIADYTSKNPSFEAGEDRETKACNGRKLLQNDQNSYAEAESRIPHREEFSASGYFVPTSATPQTDNRVCRRVPLAEDSASMDRTGYATSKVDDSLPAVTFGYFHPVAAQNSSDDMTDTRSCSSLSPKR